MLITRAHISLAQDEPEQARRDAHDSLTIAAKMQSFLHLSDIVECIAELAADSGDHQHAAHLFGSAHAVRRKLGVVRFPLRQASFDAAAESSREALGKSSFDAAWTKGSALSIRDVISCAQRGHGKRKRPDSGWESLTPTEIDVVRLTREGFTNKEIAARLFISPRTV